MTVVRTIWRMAITDLTRWVRVPSLIAATLIPAIGMGITVLALSYAVGRQPVALVQLGHGPMADEVVNEIRHSDGFFLVERNAAQAMSDMRSQRVAGVITIPAGFDQAVHDQGGLVDVLVNNVDLDFADDVRRSVSEAVVAVNTKGEDDRSDGAGAEAAEQQGFGTPGEFNPYHVGLVEHDVRGGDTKFLDYQLIPVLGLLALTTGALVTALAIAGDRESGSLRILSVAPVARLGLTLGRLLGGTLAACAVLAAVCIPMAWKGWLHPPAGRWPVVAALLFLTALGSTGLGVVIGMITRRVASTVLLGVNVVAACFLLGGGFTTVAFLPGWVQRVAHLTPSYYAVEGLREAMFYSRTPAVGTDLLVLALAAVLSVTVGAATLRRAANAV